ncbi:MAG: alpha/beta hydrolase [Microcoleaceae cyanobacterium]
MPSQFLTKLQGQLFAQICAIGTGISILGFASSALAIDSVTVRYNDNSATITFAEIQDFVNGANVEALTSLLEDRDRAQDVASETADTLRRALTKKISVTPSLRQRVENLLSSPRGEAFLGEVNNLVGSAETEVQQDLGVIRTTLVESLEDNSVSLLEIIERYPEDNIVINATGLTDIVDDVVTFVEFIEPKLEAVQEVLQDFICDCEPATSASSTAQ